MTPHYLLILVCDADDGGQWSAFVPEHAVDSDWPLVRATLALRAPDEAPDDVQLGAYPFRDAWDRLAQAFPEPEDADTDERLALDRAVAQELADMALLYKDELPPDAFRLAARIKLCNYGG